MLPHCPTLLSFCSVTYCYCYTLYTNGDDDDDDDLLGKLKIFSLLIA